MCYSKSILFCSAFGDKNQTRYIKTLRMHALNTYWIDWVTQTIHCNWCCYKPAEIVNVRLLSLRLSPTWAASAEHAKVGRANDRMVLAFRLSHSAAHCLCRGMCWGAICILTFLFAAWLFPIYDRTVGGWLALLNELIQNGSDAQKLTPVPARLSWNGKGVMSWGGGIADNAFSV